MPSIAPFGSWISPLTAEMAAVAATPFNGLALDGRDIYWAETRPQEGGRYTIMCRKVDGPLVECLPPDFNARTTVHEYGGGAFAVNRGILYFANYKDQKLYRQSPGGRPVPLTLTEGYRYADITVDHGKQRLICVREDHTGQGEAVNTIVGIDLAAGGDGHPLVTGNDFYSNPRLSPDGTQLAYLTWNHPNMPWDGCELRVAPVLPDGELGQSMLVAGGAGAPIFQPEWSPDGVLHYVAEPEGWWNLFRWEAGHSVALLPMAAEFGRPMWMFGYATYGFTSGGKILCAYSDAGRDYLAWLDSDKKTLRLITAAYTEIDFLRCGDGIAAFIAGSPTLPYTVVWLDLMNERMEHFRPSLDVTIDEGYISVPEQITFPTTGGRSSHAWYYAPRNRDYAAPPEGAPPLIVISHGGPTSSAVTALRYAIQYWTSRGFAVADVNYGGSVGYGREYRQRLSGMWGVVDVDDCCNAALYLAEKGLVDRQRLAIRGGSAGGFCTFACLTFRSEVFSAGAALYGVADLMTFTADTHKFESRYLSTLVGPYPDRADLYFERSPINFIENIRCPLILFQGDEDKVVPPAQSEMMFEAVRRKGLPTAYLLFPGEQHGFRRIESLKRAAEAELYFYSRVFGFQLAEPVEPVKIENWPPGD